MVGFEVAQFAEEGVVFAIGDLWIVEHVVTVVVIVDLLPQPLDPLLDVLELFHRIGPSLVVESGPSESIGTRVTSEKKVVARHYELVTALRATQRIAKLTAAKRAGTCHRAVAETGTEELP